MTGATAKYSIVWPRRFLFLCDLQGNTPPYFALLPYPAGRTGLIVPSRQLLQLGASLLLLLICKRDLASRCKGRRRGQRRLSRAAGLHYAVFSSERLQPIDRPHPPPGGNSASSRILSVRSRRSPSENIRLLQRLFLLRWRRQL